MIIKKLEINSVQTKWEKIAEQITSHAETKALTRGLTGVDIYPYVTGVLEIKLANALQKIEGLEKKNDKK